MNRLFTILIMSLAPIILFGQKGKKQDYLIKSIQNVAIDANLNEWDNLLFQEESPVWSFSLAQNNDTIFAAVVVRDKGLIAEAINQGIFVNISNSDKKKDGARLLYPTLSQELLSRFVEDEFADRNFSNEQLLNSTRGYLVFGFSRIINSFLSFDNTYGIRAVAKMNEKGELIYESAIPLSLVKIEKEEFAVQVGVNTRFAQVQKSMKTTPNRPSYGGYGMYGRMTPVRQMPKNPYSEPTEVWFKGKRINNK